MCAGEYKVDPMDRQHELTYNFLTIQDIVERFSLTLMLSLIAGRNLIEIVGSDIGFDPRSLLRGNGVLKTIMSVSSKATSDTMSSTLNYYPLSPACSCRDSLGDGGRLAQTRFHHEIQSHQDHDIRSIHGCTLQGYITRRTDFQEWPWPGIIKSKLEINWISESESRVNLACGLSQRRTLLTDRSTLVTRRLGFAALPLACLVIRITAQAFGMVWSNATPSVLEDASRSALVNTFERWWRPISTTLVFAIGWFWYVGSSTEYRTG